MKTHVQTTVQLGDLIVAAFDKAARFSADPRQVSQLATQTVASVLRGARKATNRR